MKQAFVNGEPISQEAVQFELDRLVKFYATHGMSQAEIKSNLEKLVEKAQEQAIGAKLLLARAEQLDIPVPDAAIDAQVEQVIRQVGGRENFVKALAAQKLSEDTFRKELAKGCRVDMLVQQACSGVAEPTEQEVAEYYAAHQAEYVAQPQVLAQHILVKTEGLDAADKVQALDKIKAIRARIVAAGDAGEVGQAFCAEARENSDCPSGAQGGSLGWFGPGMMVPEFDKAAFEMKVGDVSDIVKTQFGYHLIYKTDHEAPQEASFEEAHDSVRDFLRHAKRGETLAAHVNELRAKADISIA